MRPLTDHTPKPLLEVGGKALIVWHIERLVQAGVTELVINHAHLGQQIEDALGDGSRYGAQIHYSPETQALETAGGIAYALPWLDYENEPFAVVNGDIWCDYDFSRLARQADVLKVNGDMAHLVLVDNPPHHSKGDFYLNQNRITPADMDCSLLTFSGIGLYHPAMFRAIERGSVAPLAPLLRTRITEGRVSGEHHQGGWIDVGTPQRLNELDTQLRTVQKHV